MFPNIFAEKNVFAFAVDLNENKSYWLAIHILPYSGTNDVNVTWNRRQACGVSHMYNCTHKVIRHFQLPKTQTAPVTQCNSSFRLRLRQLQNNRTKDLHLPFGKQFPQSVSKRISTQCVIKHAQYQLCLAASRFLFHSSDAWVRITFAELIVNRI